MESIGALTQNFPTMRMPAVLWPVGKICLRFRRYQGMKNPEPALRESDSINGSIRQGE